MYVNHEHNETTYNDHYHDHGDGHYRDDGYYDDGYYEDGYYEERRTTRRRRSTGGSASGHVHERTEARDTEPVADPYFTLGLGAAGLDAAVLDDGTMSGTDFNLGLGAKTDIVSAEVGLHVAGYEPVDPDRDISMYGLTGDVRLQPRLGFFEPYALLGVGVHGLADSETDFASVGPSLRLGLGADVRIDDFGLSARYLYSAYGFDDTGNGRTLDGGYEAESSQLGLNVLFYF